MLDAYLRHHQHPMAVEAVNPDAGNRTQQKDGNLTGKTYQAKQESGVRQAIHQPTGGYAGHPRADQRDALPAEEQAIIAML